MLEQCCNHSKQCRNNVETLCCAKNRRCESSRATSPENLKEKVFTELKGTRELSRSTTNFSAAGCRLFCLFATFKTSLTTYSFLGSIFTFWWKTFSGSYFTFNSFSLCITFSASGPCGKIPYLDSF